MRKYRNISNCLNSSVEEVKMITNSVTENMGEFVKMNQEMLYNFENIDTVVSDIDKEFAKKTGIVNKKDQMFLWTAVALQTVRWMILPKLKFDMETPNIEERIEADTKEEKNILKAVNEKFEDDAIERIEKEKKNDSSSSDKFIDKFSYFKSPVPYDAMYGEEAKLLDLPGVKKNPDSQLSGKTHHAATLGHDPILGYFFGTMNIMTYTITFHKQDLQTNEVYLIGDTWEKEIGKRVSFTSTLLEAIQAEMDDVHRIPFAVLRHQIHLMTDENTKMGLPIPLLSASKQQSLLEKGWNSQELKKIKDSFSKYRKENITTVALQNLVASIINIIIKSLHLLLYDEDKDESFDLYRVRTNRILAVSNTIASSINIVYVGINVVGGVIVEDSELVKKGIENIDLGGYIETVHQIVSSKSLQEKIRREYLEKELNETFLGDNYSFLEENTYE